MLEFPDLPVGLDMRLCRVCPELNLIGPFNMHLNVNRYLLCCLCPQGGHHILHQHSLVYQLEEHINQSPVSGSATKTRLPYSKGLSSVMQHKNK